MQTFKADSKLFWRNSIKEFFLLSLVILLVAYIYFLYKPSKLNLDSLCSNILYYLVILFIIILRAIFLSYYINTIEIDENHKMVSIKLKSKYTGWDIQNYPIDAISVNFNPPKLFIGITYRSSEIIIQISKNKYYRLTSRYGFSDEVLKELIANLNQLKKG